MRMLRVVLAIGLGVVLAGCSATGQSGGNATAIAAAANSTAVQARPDAPVSVRNVTVRVPETLTVSEQNRYYPSGDIVWREDPPGDRHAQVKAIVEAGITRGAATLKGAKAVDLDIDVTRFHALTEKARFSIGGVHSITFSVTLKDPNTGKALGPARVVHADLKAYGGQEAIDADAKGLTQKFRITNHLANVIVVELSDPEGYQNANLGILQAINNN